MGKLGSVAGEKTRRERLKFIGWFGRLNIRRDDKSHTNDC
jgi:hypothetical protein